MDSIRDYILTAHYKEAQLTMEFKWYITKNTSTFIFNSPVSTNSTYNFNYYLLIRVSTRPPYFII